MQVCRGLLSAGLLLLLAAPAMAQVQGFPPKLPAADLVLRDAQVVSLAPLQGSAQALAVKDGKILALGSNAAMAAYIGDKTRVMDLHGAVVMPGFIEGHGHLMGTGEALQQLDVGKAKNWDAIVALVKDAVAKARPGQWIIGNGWQQSKWDTVPSPAVNGLPLPAGLDAVSPHNPVLLNHASGHAIYANAMALKLAGIDRDTPDPAGGSIVHDADGNPIGMLRDSAADPVFAAWQRAEAALPASERQARREQALQLAMQNEVSQGITAFVDMGEDFATVDWLKTQAGKGFPLRLFGFINGESVAALDAKLADYRVTGLANDHYTVNGIGEILSDGALGTRSAWFLAPYHDAPALTGKNVVAMEDIRRIAEIAAREGFQLGVHAIGDRANRETLDVFAQIFDADPAAHALRWRIEHAQHLDPADIPRFAQLGVIASMQSIHACSDAPYVLPRLGAQRAEQGAYVWHSLIDSGAMVLDGSDTPVEGTSPIAGFYCAVTRDNGRGQLFYPGQAKTRLQALRSYTWNNAYAVHAEDRLGSLAPGKLADMVVLSGNLLTLPVDQILRTRVLYTIVGGELVYQREGAGSWRPGQAFPAMPEFNHVN